jgi:nitroreductase
MTYLDRRVAAPLTTHPTAEQVQLVDAAILSRMSTRAFRPDPVPEPLLRELLEVASAAPSGTNTQPWRVYVLRGAIQQQVVEQVCAAHDALAADPSLASRYSEAYDYYPKEWKSPFIDRRRACGFGLYGVLGIGKGDKAKMHAQHQRNYRFFDAPVGLMFTIDKIMGAGSLVDYGMFLQSIMIAARARGLHTCPQAAWNPFASIILPLIGASDQEMLVCGMSLGYADDAEVVNSFRTEREPVENFTVWL